MSDKTEQQRPGAPEAALPTPEPKRAAPPPQANPQAAPGVAAAIADAKARVAALADRAGSAREHFAARLSALEAS